ncbi:MAG: dihydrodipicolinate synthase family protein [Vicinamibacterales bacterium]
MDPETFLRGVYNITPTPFLEDGAVDETSVRTLTDFTIARGVDGLTILGVMGEAAKLTDVERDRVIVATLDAANGRVPVCVGTTHAGTDGCVAFSRRAEALGAAAVMVAPPRLARSSDAALQRHYVTVAGSVSLPIVVQDHPASSGVHMHVEWLAALADAVPQCRFLKAEDEPTPPKISAVLSANPDLRVFGGLGATMLLEELRRGVVGTMTGFGFPEVLVDICRRYFSGDVDGATAAFYRVCPLIRFENQPSINLALRKEIYRMRGAMATARPRAPFAALDDGTRRDLLDVLRRLHLLPDGHA